MLEESLHRDHGREAERGGVNPSFTNHPFSSIMKAHTCTKGVLHLADQATVKRLEGLALNIRKDLLRLCNKVQIHIGGDLSVADVMTVLWQYKMKYDPQNPKWPERDRFILSKGHASAVTSLNQAILGCYQKEDIFNEYATDFGRFGMHSCNLINPHVEVSTGSLGHGLPVAVGMAAGMRLKGNNTSRVYVVMGDGEQDEGSVWEGAMAARQFKLGNIVAFVDRNHLQIDGSTEQVMDLEPFADKWTAFGWNVIVIPGNDIDAIVDVVDNLPAPTSLTPTMVICETAKGKGVAHMENEVNWHFGMLSDEDLADALQKLDDAYEAKWGEKP